MGSAQPRMVLRALALVSLLAVAPAWAKSERSAETRREFQRAQPCPSTGKGTGACPGYVRDHMIPLCKGGPDVPSNMQWQTIAEGKAKDKWECRSR